MAKANHSPSPAQGNGDDNARLRALEQLRSRHDPEALREIETALGDESWRVRKSAVELIRRFPDAARASGLLVRALGDEENAGRRAAAMEALTLMGSDAVPHLIEAVKDPDEDVRKFIVDILGQIRDPRSVDAILALTTDPSENIRLSTIETLGSIGGDKAYTALISLLDSEDVSLQFGILYALGKIGKPIPLEKIKPLADKKILQRAVYDALGQTKSSEAVELLVEGLIDAGKSAKQSALRSLHHLSTVPALTHLVEAGLKKRFDRGSLEPVSEFIDSNHGPTRQAAISLLSLIGSPQAIKFLVRASDNDAIKADVEAALAAINSRTPGFLAAVSQQEKGAEAKEIKQLIREAPEAIKALGPMSADQFLRIRDLVSRESGLFYDSELKYLVERRVQRRMEVIKLHDYDQYADLVDNAMSRGRAELKQLINSLSTNETYFFREDFQLKAFQEEILPALLAVRARPGSEPIRIWSAGSSSGEEAYTIAILIKERMPNNGPKVEILGSDINDNMVKAARQGSYGPSSFRATSPELLERWFTPEGNRYKIKDEVRSMVSFDHTNLIHCAEEPALQNLDVIFCRNVIIYFSTEAKRRVVEQFHQLLKPGGYLLLGHSESLMSVTTSFELVHLKNDLVYRRPLQEGKS